jgi:aldose 1-epimerase
MKKLLLMVVTAAVALNGCTKKGDDQEKGKMDIPKGSFGTTKDGQAVDIYTLKNANGAMAKITNYGGIVTELYMPDKAGKMADIVCGFKTLAEYEAGHPYFGSLIGRYGNRIAKGKFTLDGKEYTLATNNNAINHLHGGDVGFDKKVWSAQAIGTDDGVGLKLTYVSPDGEEGYPGTLTSTVTYVLTNANELRISYKATTDKPTILNLTHHGYFNLTGHDSGDILDHVMMITADNYTPVDATLIPTGEIKPVAGTPMDFTKPTAIGARIDQVEGGYDINFVLNNSTGTMALAAKVTDPKSGRVMEVLTTEPGLQFYTGNFLDGTKKGKGATYNQHAALCLETQHFPDSPNKPQFPSVVLRPGETYTHETIYRFSAR